MFFIEVLLFYIDLSTYRLETFNSSTTSNRPKLCIFNNNFRALFLMLAQTFCYETVTKSSHIFISRSYHPPAEFI